MQLILIYAEYVFGLLMLNKDKKLNILKRQFPLGAMALCISEGG